MVTAVDGLPPRDGNGLLLRGDEVLCAVEVARSFAARSRGLLGRDGIGGALLLAPASSVHGFRMRFDLDVAFLDRDLVVLRTVTLRRNRMTRLVRRSKAVLEAEAGAFSRWGLERRQQLRVTPAGEAVDEGGPRTFGPSK